ncbi:Aspartyl/asparaginyl beta-hydroxylase, partial [Plecturocebus cupreus]
MGNVVLLWLVKVCKLAIECIGAKQAESHVFIFNPTPYGVGDKKAMVADTLGYRWGFTILARLISNSCLCDLSALASQSAGLQVSATIPGPCFLFFKLLSPLEGRFKRFSCRGILLLRNSWGCRHLHHAQLIFTSGTLFIVIVEGEDLQQEEDGPAGEPQPEDEDFLTASDVDDRFETLEPEVFHEVVVSLCVAKAGLKLMASSNSPTSASQSVGITGMSH